MLLFFIYLKVFTTRIRNKNILFNSQFFVFRLYTYLTNFLKCFNTDLLFIKRNKQGRKLNINLNINATL